MLFRSIGMSGIAEILHNLDYKVQGSDLADNANVRRLRAMGIQVEVGHKAENVEHVQAVVVSSAVKADNAVRLIDPDVSITSTRWARLSEIKPGMMIPWPINRRFGRMKE